MVVDSLGTSRNGGLGGHSPRKMFPGLLVSRTWRVGFRFSLLTHTHQQRDPTITEQERRIFRRPLNIWRKKDTGNGKMEIINNSYHVWVRAEETSSRHLSGWISSQEPEHFTLQELGFQESHISHPFPIANTLSMQGFSSLSTWEPFLYSRVRIATFHLAGEIGPLERREALMDSTGKHVGILYTHGSGYERPSAGKRGQECCLMAVCEALVPQWNMMVRDYYFDELGNFLSTHQLLQPPPPLGKPFKWVDVLQIQWRNQIAYQRGVGKVALDAWEQASPQETNIILG